MRYHRGRGRVPSWTPNDVTDMLQDDPQHPMQPTPHASPPPWAAPVWAVSRARHTPEPQGFPFWKLALAIALGLVIAAALIWTAVEARARYELRQLQIQMQAIERKAQADLARQRQLQADQRRAAQQQQAALAEQRRRAEASRDRRPILRQGHDSMPAGTVACMFGYQSQRMRDGGWQQLLVGGQAQPCRSG
jgi:uncharacterized protein HemX